jgi:HEAT repeat protein
VLRDRVIAGLRAESGRWGPLVTRLASVTSAVLDDWPAAWEMLRNAEAQGATGPHWEVRTRALRLLATVVEGRWGPDVNFEAVQTAASLGPVITDLLQLAMGTSDRRRRRAFLIALSLIGDARALDVYIEALADTYRDSPRWATRALLEVGEPAVPALLEAATSDEPRVRRYAIRCLGLLRDPRARDVVLEALRDPDPAIWRQAVLALRPYLRAEDAPELKEVMRGSRAETRAEAREVLLSLGEVGVEAGFGLPGREEQYTNKRYSHGPGTDH